MTSKKKRQRGSRTHGTGNHKNNSRGAGHRGGRGDAGRDKHERQLYGPLGKFGFKRPEDVQEEVLEVTVQELDEDARLFVTDGVAEETDDGIAIDARDVLEDGHEADVVKVLGNGDVRRELLVTADAFTGSAREQIEENGGEARLSERAERAEEEGQEDADEDDELEA
jgi:large subunit ribosomal protein L15